MEQQHISETPESTENVQPGYEPRPLWQVWAARVGLVVFLIFVLLQILVLFRGGM